MPEPPVWVLTTGEAGMRSQAVGLAERLGLPFAEKRIGLRAPWRWLPGHLAPLALHGLDPAYDRLAPPWPALVISCGRRSTAPSIAIRRAARGTTTTVHVQDPQCPPGAFDLVVAMRHDGLDGPNVIRTDTALHRVTREALAAGRDLWRDAFAALPAPRIGVILGGRNRHYRFTANVAERLAANLERLLAATAGSLLITPSRRTEPEVTALLAARLGARPDVYLWDMAGENPYFGILGHAERFVVTSDSVSMVSEALATGQPVETVDLDGSSRRHGLFVHNLIECGLVRSFTGDPVPPPRPAIPDATDIAADAVRRLLTACGVTYPV